MVTKSWYFDWYEKFKRGENVMVQNREDCRITYLNEEEIETLRLSNDKELNKRNFKGRQMLLDDLDLGLVYFNYDGL